MSSFSRIAFTPGVQAIQERMGSRRAYARRESGPADRIGPDEAAFIAERDSFYMATVSETGWPYVQHRGGPKGFVRVVDEHTLSFADERGNKQYVTAGNLAANDRVALIFVDYPNRARLKVLARATAAEVEGTFVLRVEGLDWNCSRNITPRYTEEEVAAIVEKIPLNCDQRAVSHVATRVASHARFSDLDHFDHFHGGTALASARLRRSPCRPTCEYGPS